MQIFVKLRNAGHYDFGLGKHELPTFESIAGNLELEVSVLVLLSKPKDQDHIIIFIIPNN